jgi:hypothetical protein
MAISIDGTHYSVEMLAPALGATKAYRFRKVGGDEAVHDLDETAYGASCSCGDFVFRHDGLDDLGCKHLRGARAMGLFAQVDEAAELARGAAFEDAREAEDLAARQVAKLATCCEPTEPSPCSACITVHTPLPADDEEDWDDDDVITLGPAAEPIDWPSEDELRWAREEGFFDEAEGEAALSDATPECFRAVAEGRADWMREFGLVPFVDWVSRENRDALLAEDAILNGWACHRGREFEDARRERTAALLAAEDAVIEVGQLCNLQSSPEEPPARTLAEQVDDHARSLRAEGSPLGDLLAERAESLAGQIRALDATTVEQFRDRRDALLASDLEKARARMAAACS